MRLGDYFGALLVKGTAATSAIDQMWYDPILIKTHT
jgi:hypothetical protein